MGIAAETHASGVAIFEDEAVATEGSGDES
jgi:hypothetical protein